MDRGVVSALALVLAWSTAFVLLVHGTSSLRYHAFWRADLEAWTKYISVRGQAAKTWVKTSTPVGRGGRPRSVQAVPSANGSQPAMWSFTYAATCHRPDDPIRVIQSLHTTLSDDTVFQSQHADVAVHMRCDVKNDTALNATIKSLHSDLGRLGIKVYDAPPCDCGVVCCETMDYVSSLRIGEATGSRFVVILEEDTWGTRDFITKLNRSVASVQSLVDGVPRLNNSTGPQLWMLKLFVSDYWSGWGFDPRHLMELGACGAIGALLGWSSAMCAISLAPARRRRWASLMATLVATLSTMLSYIVGRQNLGFDLLNRGSGVMEHEFEAGSLGLVLPREAAASAGASLKLYAQAEPQVPVDLLLGEWRRKVGVRQYIVLPCLVQHNGVRTSLSWKQDSSKNIDYNLRHTKVASRFEG